MRDGALVVGATLVWHASNFAFNLVAARALGPASYGELAAAVTLLYLANPLLVSVQTIASRMSTTLWTRGDGAAIRAGLRFHARRLWIASLLLATGVAASSGTLARFLRIASGRPLVILACAFPFYFVTHLQRGVLQGTLRFRRYAISSVCEALVKLLATLVMLLVVWRAVDAAVLAVVLSAALAMVVNGLLLRYLPRRRERREPASGAPGYSATTVVSLLLLAVLLSADIFAARRYLGPHEAGLYASVSLCGKIVFFATSCLALVLFPLFSARQEQGLDARGFLRKGVLLAGAAAAAIVAIYALTGPTVVTGLFGSRFSSGGAFLAPMGVAFALYGLVYLAAMFLLSQKRSAAVAPLAIAVVAQLAGFLTLHSTPGELIAVNATVFGLTAVALLRIALAPEPLSRPALELR